MICPRRMFPALSELARDVCAKRTESKRKGCEESGGAVVPAIDQLEWVPENSTVKGDACTRCGNTDKARYSESETDWKYVELVRWIYCLRKC